jgi:site-specific DNA-methyltransferase (adenine-specific)
VSTPYYEDDAVALYLGSFRDHLADLYALDADAVITDPPYGETSLEWDSWPKAWPHWMVDVAPSLWCFGSFRMFMDNRAQFDDWKFSHEIVWEKHNGSGFAADKFRRVHELAALWYRGDWSSIRHEVPRVASATGASKSVRKRSQTPHTGTIAQGAGYIDDGLRMQTSVIRVPSEHGVAVHPTQKPLEIISPLIEYSVPVGGMVVDPFAGSGTTLLAAKLTGRRAVGVEINEAYCEAAARRLSQQSFDFEDLQAIS